VTLLFYGNPGLKNASTIKQSRRIQVKWLTAILALFLCNGLAQAELPAGLQRLIEQGEYSLAQSLMRERLAVTAICQHLNSSSGVLPSNGWRGSKRTLIALRRISCLLSVPIFGCKRARSHSLEEEKALGYG
jgi:hypothetical protein